MKIGELARETGCTVETIRYYEKVGLLPKAMRSQENNYRFYNQKHLDLLLFIRRCRTLAMTHEEIQQLLQAREEPDNSCVSINELIAEHLEHVRARIEELQALESQLEILGNECHSVHAARDCGILKKLDEADNSDWQIPKTSNSHVEGSRCHHKKS